MTSAPAGSARDRSRLPEPRVEVVPCDRSYRGPLAGIPGSAVSPVIAALPHQFPVNQTLSIVRLDESQADGTRDIHLLGPDLIGAIDHASEGRTLEPGDGRTETTEAADEEHVRTLPLLGCLDLSE
jgi:hypothetical protein